MGVIDNKVFQSGNDAAVILPKDIAFQPGTPVTIERKGEIVTIEPVRDRAEEKRKLSAMVAALRALGPIGEIGKRDPIEFPERPGM